MIKVYVKMKVHEMKANHVTTVNEAELDSESESEDGSEAFV